MKKVIVCVTLMLLVITGCTTTGKKHMEDGTVVYTGDGDKKLQKEYVVKGRVLDAQSKDAVAGATVELKNAQMGVGYYLEKTDSGGYFKIENFIPQVRYIIEVVADGYVTYKTTEKVETGKRTIYLQKEGILTGVVRGGDGKPVQGVQVKLRQASSGYGQGNKPFIQSTGDDGSYSFNKLPAGRYMATFSKPGYITETARIKYIKNGETFTLPMVVYEPASISGKIGIKQLDAPAINVDVQAVGRVTYSASTFHDGTYVLEDLKPGNYKLRVHHRGFDTMETSSFKITEGERKKEFNYEVTPKDPALSVYSYRYTFVPGNKLSFNLRTFRLESVKVRVYQVPLNTFLQGHVDPDTIDPGKEKFKVFTEWSEPIHNFKPYEWRYQSLELKDQLPTGGYCIEVEGAGKMISRKFFSVTSVGVVAKRSQYSMFTYVTHLAENKPIKGASVVVFDSTPEKKQYRYSTHPYKPPKRIEDLPVKILKKGKTDSNGVFTYRMKSRKHYTVLVIGEDGSYALCSTGSPSAFDREKNKYFIYTDRPVYRAGDTVFYKVVGKERKRRFMPLDGQKLHYRIINRDFNSTVDEGQLTLDQWGTFHGKIAMAADARLGEYDIRVGPSKKNLYAAGRYYMEQYRKPEFKIDITPSKPYFTNGDTVEFKVETKYFFGAPLKNGLVRYRFYETRMRDTDTTYWWEEDYPSRESYNRIRLEGEKYLNDEGVAVLRFDSGNYPYDRKITLEATVMDKSNISITSSNSVKVGRGEYYIKINPDQNFYADNEKKKIEIQTLSHTGDPIRAGVNLDLYRYVWKPLQRVYVHEKRPLFSKKITTDKKGRATVELPRKFSYYGEFDLVAESTDRYNNRINANRIIWVYSKQGGEIKSKLKNLELTVDKTSLKEPGRITCLVKSRFTDSYVCLTLEGRDVYHSRVVKMKGNITPVTFEVKPEYAPNFYLTATMQRKRALYTSRVDIELPVAETGLSIEMKNDKKVYKPGEKATVHIKVTDKNGNPLKADLSLAAVDEAIYQIRPDHTPKMQDFFYTKISNWVLTSYSYPIHILAGAAKEGKVKIREKFEDTAFWKGKIRTDDAGRASVTFTLPDNLTVWRLTARGHDRQGRVGEHKSEFQVTQDLIARIGRPRFAVEGDTMGIIGIVNSNTKRGLKEVKTTMQINGKKVVADNPVKISLPGFGSSREYYTTTIPEDKKKLTMEYTAIADPSASDALRLHVPVQRRGVNYKLYGTGDMANNSKIVIQPLKDSTDFDFIPESVTIQVNPSPVIQMLRATEYLMKYPYGCIEQTINRFLPAMAVYRLAERQGYGALLSGKSTKELHAKVDSGISRLQQLQNSDGSWGWWYGDRGNGFVTGYILSGFMLAQKNGYAISKNTIDKGVAAVARMLKYRQVSHDAMAYLLYVYALHGKWDQKAYEYCTDKLAMNPYQLAYMVRALAKADGIKELKSERKQKLRKDLKKFLAALKEKQELDGRGIYWPSVGSQQWGWPGGRAEITAHVLSALVETGDTTSLVSRAVRSLTKRGKGGAWNSTKETATVIFALGDYIDSIGAAPKTSGKVAFTLDGKHLTEYAYDLSGNVDMKDFTKTLPLEGERRVPAFTVEAAGDTGRDLSYEVVINGTLKFKDAGVLSLFKSETRSVNALSNGIQIARSFSYVTRVKDIHHNEYLVPQNIDDKRELKIGDELLVKVRFVASDDFEYLVLEDYLPAGFEVVNENAYDGYQPYVNAERWDNRMVFFFNSIQKGKYFEIAYIIRAELPGTFSVKPSRMECMYEPTIQGWAPPGSIEIDKKE